MMAAAENHRDDLAHQFGENVRRYREHRGLSQADLAGAMAERGWPWHQSTTYKIEHGTRRTDAYEVHDLAEILGVPMDRLFWAGPEASGVGLAIRASANLRTALDLAADAVARLHAARASAERTLGSTRDSQYPRVREACAELEAELAAATLDAALAEGAARWEPEEDS